MAALLFLGLLVLREVSTLGGLYHARRISNPGDGSSDTNGDNVISEVFRQILDHFDNTESTFWEQRYLVNDEFFDKNKRDRAFLFIGGEGVASSRPLRTALSYQAAKKHGAIMFLLEHRFYGKSQPFTNLSTENLRYLSSQQALADAATFIQGMNEEYNLSSGVKWIIVGGSYAGSLAAWMRLKYPHLIHGAVSSSAPLFAKLLFPEYLQIVSNDLRMHSKECIDNINTALAQLEDRLDGHGEENLSSSFNLCNDIQGAALTELDKENVLEYVIDSFAYVAQSHSSNVTVAKVCDIMNNKSVTAEIQRLGAAIRLINGNDTEDCAPSTYTGFIDKLSNITISDTDIMRQWWYQTCTEFGWYQISTQDNEAFKNRIPLNFFMNLCSDLYGSQFNETFINETVARTNTLYGGFDIKVSNVVFTQGTLDPWYPMGLTRNLSEDYSVIFINGTSHCADLSNPTRNDSSHLLQARKEILRLVDTWLERVNILEANGSSNKAGHSVQSFLLIIFLIFIKKVL